MNNAQEFAIWQTKHLAKAKANPGKPIIRRAGLYTLFANEKYYIIERRDRAQDFEHEIGTWFWHDREYDAYGYDISDSFASLRDAVSSITKPELWY